MQVTDSTPTGTIVSFVSEERGVYVQRTGTLEEHEGNGFAKLAITHEHRLGAEPRRFSMPRNHVAPISMLHTAEDK